MLQRRDEWNPDTFFIEHECRIYGDDRASIYSVIDDIDYQWALQWRWSPKFSKRGKKFYLRRCTNEGSGAFYECPETGRIRRNRTQRTLFLHTAIMLRSGVIPPTKKHVLVDHRDGDAMNCRRSNLRWATHTMNSRNVFGSHGYELGEVDESLCRNGE